MSKDSQGNPPRKGRKIRIPLRRNRSRPARKKDWTHDEHETPEQDVQAARSESVVPKGELSRYRTVVVRDEDKPTEPGLQSGTVVAVRGLYADVDTGEQVVECTIRRVLRTRLIAERNPITVGDRVHVRREPLTGASRPDAQTSHAAGVIEEVEPRRSEMRRMAGKRVHVIAANVDQAVIVSSADLPPPKPHLIDRYIVSAQAGNMVPVICLNKMDLDADGLCARLGDRYAQLAYRTLLTSAVTGEGIDALVEAFRGRTSVIVGQSGVGKSSLLNAIEPGLQLKTGDVMHVGKGRHITTTATLLKLSVGGFVVDTPGVRSFDVTAIPRHELEAHFVEFLDHIPNCKFPDCTHRHETDCAVKAAAEAGKIHPERYESYVRMFEDAATDEH